MGRQPDRSLKQQPFNTVATLRNFPIVILRETFSDRSSFGIYRRVVSVLMKVNVPLDNPRRLQLQIITGEGDRDANE